MSSSIGPARAALYALLVAAAGTTGNPLNNGAGSAVQVVFGPPDQYEENEVVGILGIRQPVEAAIVLGPQPNVRDEQYAIEVAIKTYDPAGTALSVEARWQEMYDAVRDVILANPRLSDTVQWALPTGQESDGPRRPLKDSPQPGEGAFEPGWVMRLDMHVNCKARS
jgi:hypothetical protein